MRLASSANDGEGRMGPADGLRVYGNTHQALEAGHDGRLGRVHGPRSPTRTDVGSLKP